MRRGMTVSILIGLTLILSAFVSTVSIVQKIAYAQARMEQSINGVPVPNSMTQRSTAVGINAEPGGNIAIQGVAGALSSHGPSITNGPQTQIALVAQLIRDDRSITNGPQVFAESSHYPPHPLGTNNKGVGTTTITHNTAVFGAFFQTAGKTTTNTAKTNNADLATQNRYN
jgi:hypothetical protein